jgi:hypothetical protein
MKNLIEIDPEFKDLEPIKDKIRFAETQFPPNCLVWVGASLVTSLNTEIDRFLTTM